jgi:hypothetical protein
MFSKKERLINKGLSKHPVKRELKHGPTKTVFLTLVVCVTASSVRS